ncbi:MAG: hypothetical protein HC804_11060, partial [Anaerolineae bacterium]|nr:hypothetical protein [Anaerolineae bacterium]
TGAALDISGWTLSDAGSVRHTFPANTIIPDGCAILVFGGGTPTGGFGNAIVQTASTGTLSLNNTGGETITLNDGVLDQASYAYGNEANNDQSRTLDPDITGALFVAHSGATGSGGALFSPGTQISGSNFAGCGGCGGAATLIHAIQGSGSASPLVGQVHTIEGIVVADFQTEASIQGFYVQEEDGDADADPLTSEGLFVYYPAFAVDVSMGQRVRATGMVTEYFGLTELGTITSVEVCSSTAVPTPSASLYPSPQPPSWNAPKACL